MTSRSARGAIESRAVKTGLGFAVALVSILLAYALIDRGAASWAHAMFSATGPAAGLRVVFVGLTHIIDPLPPLAGLGVLASGVALAGSREARPRLRVLFASCAATLIAIPVKDQLKLAFGRVWPETWVNDNPSWIANGAYGFFPLHGGIGWTSFPSGHMTVISAPLVVLMLAFPAWRAWLAVPIALVAIGLYGADYHFISDMIAGLLLGALCAGIVWRVAGRAPEPSETWTAP